MPEKQTNREQLKEITDSIEQGIQELFQSEKYRQYLRVMSRFHRYSVNNQMLIYLQKPDATLVAGFNKWRDQFGRSVNKGERGIKIIAPTPYKKKIQAEKLDPDTQLPMLDGDGKIITEEKEVKIPMYRPVTVFDVAQTTGKPLPELASDLAGNVENFEVFWEALKRASPVPIELQPIAQNMDGFFSPATQSITIRAGMSEVQTVCAAVHEIAHAKLHNYEKVPEPPEGEPVKKKDRRTEEVEAESISFAVCAYYGIETGENSFGYIATWSKGRELKELRASLETINQTASELIGDIDRHYAEICKERGIDPKAQAALPEPPEQSREVPQPEETPLPDPAISIEARNAYGYMDDNMLPLTRERAMELFQQDCTVYMLYEGGGEGMAFELEDIQLHTGIFGITREEWELVKDSVPAKSTADHSAETEKQFLENPADSFAIYQLRPEENLRDYRFMGTALLEKQGLTIQREHYEAVYAGTLTHSGETDERLESLYNRFNSYRPDDFKGHSLSVSDVVALKQNGVVSCHYCDSIGFTPLPGFLEQNYLRNAEMTLEDDYDQIDGMVNNGKNPALAEKPQEKKPEAKEKRPSVLAKLRAYQKEDWARQPGQKHREMEY